MSLFLASGILISIVYSIVAAITFFHRKTQLHNIWTLFNLSVFFWGAGAVLIALSKSSTQAIVAWKIAHIGIIFIPTSFYHLICIFCNKKRPFLISLVYFQAIFFLVLDFLGFYFSPILKFSFNELFYINPTIWYSVSLVIWVFLVMHGHYLLFKEYVSTNSLKKQQISYFFAGTIFGFAGGLMNFFEVYGIHIYPGWNILLPIYPLLVSYAIFRYRLMGVNLIITRTSIFIGVYSIVLGIPFFVAFAAQPWLKLYLGDMWWLTPLILLTVLATAGPFIYLYIQKRAEDKLFQDQKRYQATLRQAATGMGRIKDLRKLVAMIVHIVTRSVRVEHSAVYLKGSDDDNYSIQGYRSRKPGLGLAQVIPIKSSLIKALNRNHNVLVYSELKQRLADAPSDKLKEIVSQMGRLKAELIIPSFVDDKLIAFLVMGPKISNELYSDDDITVFSILSSQAALAIENCQFYLEMRATHEQLFQAEKMATIGIMADGLSHQINNRLHALGFIAGDALDTVQMKKDVEMPEEIKEVFVDLEHALNRIQENVTQGGEIVQGLLKYTRKAEEGFGEVELDILVDEALKMAQFKIKTGEMQVVREFPPGLPQIRGNFTQLQEVFFNLIDNAYDAMMQRRSEKREEGYQPKIIIRAEARGRSRINITLSDNGIGIKQEDQRKIFTPFFTTKLSSKKGTGLGLYVIQKLIEENHKGKVIYRSQYMKGTQVYVTLPTVDKVTDT